jgi:anaerobic magnesium-protoporphyrin IX monomethyl ester cyclase
VLAPRRPFIQDLDALPWIDWDEIDLEAYGQLYNYVDVPPLGGTYIPIATSRGCPYRCTYCHGHFGRRARERDPERLVEEIAHDVRRWGVRDFQFCDDIFNLRRGRISEFTRALRRRKLDIGFSFPNALRGDRLTAAEIEDLADAGCYAMSLSVETLTERFQRMIRKKLRVERVLEAAETAVGCGILTRCYLMMGFPGEKPEEMRDMIERIARSPFDIVHIFTVAPNPGTELFDLAVEAGFDPGRVYGADYDYDRCIVNASGLDDRLFGRILDWARLHPYRFPERQQRLRAFYRRHGPPGHPIYVRGAHWRLALGEELGKDLEVHEHPV